MENSIFFLKWKAIIWHLEKLRVLNDIECSQCKLCEEACDIGAIKVDKDDSVFIYEFETDGSLPARELVLRAADILKEKAEQMIMFLDK